ncbi:peptidoglycan binding protein CsiV [Photobacterium sagamiensis]|uniref:peptidoglycan binding protein CsiV n=1 Tax=Photobacterium sagamiensis TaxID=2910241 RepID=UPI003D12A79B
MKKLVYILLLAVSWPTFAARQFDVEIILFKRNINPDQVSESWPDQKKPLDMRGTMTFGDTDRHAAKGVTLLSPDQYQLTNQYQKLKNHAGFTPLAHVAWRQGDKGKGAAPKFHLTSGKDFSDRYLADGTSKAELRRRQLSEQDSTHDADAGSDITIKIGNDVADTDLATDAAGNEAPLYQLEGKIQVYVQHYLFADVNLDLREPGRREVIVGTEPLEGDYIDTETETESNVQVGHLQEVKKKVEVEEFLKSYRLSQQRRMRSGETHYLDNPLMGMIIQVRRVGE